MTKVSSLKTFKILWIFRHEKGLSVIGIDQN